MGEDTFLTDDLVRQLMGVGEVDLLVGISSQDSASAIGPAIRAIEDSFQQHFVRQRVVIVLMDGESKDGDNVVSVETSAPEEKRAHGQGLTALRTIHRVKANFVAPPTAGVALRTILAVADLLRARACAVVSPASTNLTAASIGNLLSPPFKDKYDFVAPLYTRHKFQGLLMRNLLYPMSRAVFGCGIREIFPSEWGFSGGLASHCLNQNIWQEEAIRAQPEAWMALAANCGGFRCCQVFIGEKSPPKAGAPGPDIVEVLRQTVGTLFWCLESQQSYWFDRDTVQDVPTLGPEQQHTSEPTEMDRHRIFGMFRSGVTTLEPILSSILDPETHSEIKTMVSLEEGKFRYRSDLWVRTLYDFAASYHHAVINRDHLVQALAPLYRGMTHSYLAEHADSSPNEIEAANEMLCGEFELQKPYLREKWNARVEVKS
jgi:glucosylglycerate synthase